MARIAGYASAGVDPAVCEARFGACLRDCAPPPACEDDCVRAFDACLEAGEDPALSAAKALIGL